MAQALSRRPTSETHVLCLAGYPPSYVHGRRVDRQLHYCPASKLPRSRGGTADFLCGTTAGARTCAVSALEQERPSCC